METRCLQCLCNLSFPTGTQEILRVYHPFWGRLQVIDSHNCSLSWGWLGLLTSFLMKSDTSTQILSKDHKPPLWPSDSGASFLWCPVGPAGTGPPGRRYLARLLKHPLPARVSAFLQESGYVWLSLYCMHGLAFWTTNVACFCFFKSVMQNKFIFSTG